MKESEIKRDILVVLMEGAVKPTQSVEYSAGYDLYTLNDTIIVPGRQLVKTGVMIGLPPCIDGHIRPRSGFSLYGMEGYTIPRFPWQKSKKKRFDADVIEGTIDCGFKKDIGVIVRSHDTPFFIEKGTRIAQIVFNAHEMPNLIQVKELLGFDRGGGFGHTGSM